MKKIFTATLFLLLACATGFGQSSYKGLTPGQSTRAEVERVFGQPTSQISENLFKYGEGGRQIYVQYSKNSPTASRIQVVYSPPAERSKLLSAERLAKVADTRRTNKQGALEEYFGYPNYIVFTYEGDSQTEVSQVGYFSRKLFESVTPELPKNSSPPSPAKPSGPAAESRPVDIPSLNANIVSLRSCVANGSIPEKDQRVYKTRFASSETMGILFELIIEHPAPGRQIDFPVSSVWYRDGAAWDTQQIEERTEADWTTTILDLGKSFKTTGKWKPGRYLVEIFIEGRKVTVGTFEVY